MKRNEMSLDLQSAELERCVDRALVGLPAVPPPPGAVERIRAATVREAGLARLRRTSAGRGRWLSAVAAGLVLLAAARWPGERTAPGGAPIAEKLDAERQLDAWDEAVLVSGQRFATLMCEEAIELQNSRLDDEALERLMDSIDRGLSLGGPGGT